MTPATVPANESDRLALLKSLRVMDSGSDPLLDDITRLASAICGTPIALVSLIDETRQWFKSKVGVAANESSRDHSFCAHTILGPELFTVEDAQRDVRFIDNPFVTADPGIRFYAGAPLIVENDLAIGSLCVIDTVPRKLTEVQTCAMQILARQVCDHLRSKITQARLHDSEEEYRAMFELAGIAKAQIDPATGRYLRVNRCMCQLTGYSEQEMLTTIDIVRVTHPDDHALDAESIRRLRARIEESNTIEKRLVRKDGTIVWAQVHRGSILDENGKVVRLISVLADITDRRLAEEQLKKSNETLEARVDERTAELSTALTTLQAEEENFRFLANSMPQIVWTGKPDGTIDYYNQRWFDYVGMTFAQTRDWGWKTVLHPDDLDQCVHLWTHSIATGDAFECEIRFRRACDGEYRWHLGRALAMRDANAKIIRWVGTSTDIHDQKMNNAALIDARDHLEQRVAERTEQLEHGRQLLESVLENISDGIVACDGAGQLTVFNRATRELHGLDVEAIPSEKWAERYSLLHADAVTQMQPHEVPLQRALAGEVVCDVEMVVANHANRSRRRVLASGRALHDPTGKMLGAVVGMHDITDRYAAEAKAKALFQYSSEPHLLVSDDKIVDCNSAMLHLFRCTDREQFLDRHPADLSPEFQPDGLRSSDKKKQVSDAIKRDRFHRFEWIHRSFDGIEIPTEVSVTALDLGGKEVWLSAIHDLTEQKSAERELKSAFASLQAANHSLGLAKDAAESATRSKSEFLANMSHEIRTPMTAILGYSDLLEQTGQKTEQAREYLRIIRSNGHHLLQVLNDVLDISKIEAGKLNVERVACSPAKILAEVESLLRVRAIEKGLSFGVLFHSKIPDLILTDPNRFRQILLNLLGNAIKFTEAGGVQIAIRTDTTSMGPKLLIEISDTGIGLTRQQLSRLFQPFDQADASISRRFGGTGLGLAICKRLTDMLNAQLSARSENGKGSTFTLTLPIDSESMLKTAVATTLDVQSPALPTFSSQYRVLVTDDGKDNRRLAMTLLESAGLQVDAAENGRTAIAKIEEAAKAGRPFDVVLMDIQMPVMDGYAATAELRRLGYADLQIVAFTAHAMAGERDVCLRAGCNGYVTKPINRGELLTAIDDALRSKPALPPANEKLDTSPLPGHLTSSMANDPFIRKILPDYLDGLPAQLDEMQQLLAGQNLEELKRAVHQLKGSGGSYGFASISTLAQHLEDQLINNATLDQIADKTAELISLIRQIHQHSVQRLV